MAVTRERFEQGLTYDQFKAHMTRNQERFEENERQLQPDPADLAAFNMLLRPVRVLVLAEDWCGDVIDNLPILGRLAAESGKLDLRIFLRDQNLDLMDQYLNQGQYRSIPVFVFFDDAFQELGVFTERPPSVTERRATKRSELYAQHPEFGSPETPISQLPEEVRLRVTEATAALRADSKRDDTQDVVHTLREIVERVPA